MWILFGLALAVIVRAEGEAHERRLEADVAGRPGERAEASGRQR